MNRLKLTYKKFYMAYLILLTRLIVFKYPLAMTREVLRSNSLEAFKFRLINSNFIIFAGIKEILFSSNGIEFIIRNIFGNIGVFIPLGFVLAIDKKSFKYILGLSLGLSLIFESIQLITGLGEFDIDDILLNVLGALLGYVLYKILSGFFLDRK